TDVFKTDSDAPFLKKAGVKDFDDPRYKKYTQRLGQLRGIKNYEYNLHVLEQKLSYEEVTEIFVRVNSLGAKLRSSVQVWYFPDTRFSEQRKLSRYGVGIIHFLGVVGNGDHRWQFLD